MMIRPVASTQARFGPYRWAHRPNEWYERWEDLPDVSGDAFAEQAEIPDRLWDHVEILDHEPLGEGGSAFAFKCVVPTTHHTYIGQVIKLPRKLYQDRADMTADVVYGHDKEQREQREKSIASFTEEFRFFEQLYHGSKWRSTIGVGERMRGVSTMTLRELKEEIAKIDHLGRRFVHVYTHLDTKIPAIFSEICDSTLKTFRRLHRDPFLVNAETLRPSPLWQIAGFQIGTAIDYIKTMGLVHADVKMDNILVRGDASDLTCLLSDYGVMFDVGDFSERKIKTTAAYVPKGWPQHAAVVDPLILTVYGFGAIMAQLLALHDRPWPCRIEKPLLYRYFFEELVDLPPELCDDGPITPEYGRQQPIWQHVRRMLTENYAANLLDAHYGNLENLLYSINDEALATSEHGGAAHGGAEHGGAEHGGTEHAASVFQHEAAAPYDVDDNSVQIIGESREDDDVVLVKRARRQAKCASAR